MTMPDSQGYPLSDQVYELEMNIYNFESSLGLHELEINVFYLFLAFVSHNGEIIRIKLFSSQKNDIFFPIFDQMIQVSSVPLKGYYIYSPSLTHYYYM